MFERFTTSAREVVRGAVQHAAETRAEAVGEAELLLALLDRTGSPAAEVLTALGAHGRRASIERSLAEVRRRGGITGADAEALAGLGIDVDEIVARVEEAHGVGALAAAGSTPARAPRRGRRLARRPFSREARSVLERSLRMAVARGDRHIGDEHLLLSLTARPGVAAHVLADHDVTYIQVERALTTRATKG
ncbi:peptidase [Streptomyces sp. SID8382]|uniref:Clp protease N-terminal domain-containing protein n=1 Tax=Streptomyces malaysiensis TaxID=92644 RepID=UPI000C2C5171|nr:MULTISPECIES: Clp protease N-terminal domain-containing protein [unclassified Streptomyces]AUA13921.1 ATP-dependent Clp protease ATP-binding subunit ClpC1 [Streptomyces sp. M56]MYX60349.1 peptidase [Streptomyces sp. SID8382]